MEAWDKEAEIYNISSPSLSIKSCMVTQGVDFDCFWWLLLHLMNLKHNHFKTRIQLSMNRTYISWLAVWIWVSPANTACLARGMSVLLDLDCLKVEIIPQIFRPMAGDLLILTDQWDWLICTCGLFVWGLCFKCRKNWCKNQKQAVFQEETCFSNFIVSKKKGYK